MSDKNFSNVINIICREPYRLFFPLGIWMGTVGLSPWLFYAFGLSETYSGFFHSSMQMLVYMNCFIVGFLMTFIPRFTGTRHASKQEVVSFLLLLSGIAIFLRKEYWVIAEMCHIIWLILLVAFVVRRIPKRKKDERKGPPLHLIWIPVAVIHGVTGTALLILGQLDILPRLAIAIGKPMMEQGFLLSIVLGIGGFLIPRISGTYQRDAQEAGESQKSCCQAESQQPKPSQTVFFHGSCAFGLFLSFLLEGIGYGAAGYGIRALVITAEFIKTNTLCRLPKGSDFYICLAQIAAWMIVIGYWGAALLNDYHIVALHIAFMGGFSLLTFAIGTMVIMSHAGAAKKLRKSLWVLWVVALGIAFATLKRIIIVLYPEAYFTFLGIASVLWIITAFCWLGFMLPYLLKVPHRDEFEKMHEEAQKRVARS